LLGMVRCRCSVANIRHEGRPRPQLARGYGPLTTDRLERITMRGLRRRLDELLRAAHLAWAALDRRLGGIPRLLKETFDSYNAHDGTFVSAAMAYYFFFTLFPLALALVVIGSLFFRSEQAQAEVIDIIVQTIPVSRELVSSIISQVVAQAGAVSILAALGFIYGASGLFGVLLAVVNRVWECPAARPSYIQRLLAIVLVLAFAVFIFLVSLATTALETLTGMQAATLYNAVSQIGTVLVVAGLFLVLFWQLPATRVYFADAWRAALITAVVWEAARRLYAWYLSRFVDYTVVYGSLAAIIGLLAWFYLSGFIILLGVELAAQIANRRERGPRQCRR